MTTAIPSRLSHYRATLGAAVLAVGLALAGCQSSAPGDAETARAGASEPYTIDWAALNEALGQYPHTTPFLQQPAIATRLDRLLGRQRHQLALQNLQVSGPLSVQGSVFYVTGNRAHMGGIEAAAIAIDETSNALRVWLLHERQAQVFAEPGADFAWPRDIQTMIGNHQP